MPQKPIPEVAEIIARFHRLRITIGLTATGFGYLSVGDAGIIKKLESGRKANAASRERLGYCLDELEKGHSIPLREKKRDREHNKNKPLTAATSEEDIPIDDRKPLLGRELEE